MNFLPRRVTSALLAAAMLISLAPVASAQVTPGAPTVGPAGGVSSTTAPSNGQGTPAGGTGVISTTRVGPSGVTPATPMAAPPAASPTDAAPAPRPRRHRRRRHYVRRAPAAETGTQSQQGTNGAAAPSAR